MLYIITMQVLFTDPETFFRFDVGLMFINKSNGTRYLSRNDSTKWNKKKRPSSFFFLVHEPLTTHSLKIMMMASFLRIGPLWNSLSLSLVLYCIILLWKTREGTLKWIAGVARANDGTDASEGHSAVKSCCAVDDSSRTFSLDEQSTTELIPRASLEWNIFFFPPSQARTQKKKGATKVPPFSLHLWLVQWTRLRPPSSLSLCSIGRCDVCVSESNSSTPISILWYPIQDDALSCRPRVAQRVWLLYFMGNHSKFASPYHTALFIHAFHFIFWLRRVYIEDALGLYFDRFGSIRCSVISW